MSDLPAEPQERLNNYEFELTDAEIAAGVHRQRVGGRWDEVGRLQLGWLVAQGLKPTDTLLDIGCGALRGGVHFARYLTPGNYFGIDSNASLIRAAVVRELPEAGIEDRVPEGNLRVSRRFDADFGVSFDLAIAQSLFTHLPLNHVQLCMFKVAQVMRPGGRFFVTFFEPRRRDAFDQPTRQPATTSYPERDPFHYRPRDLAWAARSVADWQFRYIGDWGHPRGQRMAEFTLRDGPPPLSEELARVRAGLRRQSKRLRRSVMRRTRARG